MFKQVISSLAICLSLNAIAQSTPTIVSYEVDTICANSYSELVLTIIIEDLDGDSTFFNSVTNNDTYLTSSFTVVPPATFAGETQRTFEIYADAGWGLSPGVNLASINIEVEGNIQMDPGTLDQDINDLKVFGPLDVILDFGTTTFCTTDNPVDLTPFVNFPGGIADHGNNSGNIMVNAFSPGAFYYDSGDGLFYEYTDEYGCTGGTSAWPTVFVSPDVSVSPSNSTCGNTDGSAMAMITGQAAPFDVYWTTGFTDQVSSTSSVSNLGSGTYYINVYDANGCHAQGPAQISDVELSVTESITDQSCPGTGDGAIDLTISGGTVDNVYWSNGMSTEDISGLGAGEYTVSIETTSGCQAYHTYYVGNPAPIEVELYSLNGEDCSTGQFSSLIDILTTGGSGSFSWNWDSGLSTSQTYVNPGVGTHSCLITDQVTGCTKTYSVDVPDYGAPYVWFNDIVKPQCNQNDGEIDAQVSVNINPIASTVWSSGATTEDLTNIGPGTYTITVTDNVGCFTTATVEIEDERPYQPQICLLTVDTSFTYNQVVWEKDVSQSIAGFNIYRETQTLGQFELVAQRPYALESSFLDNSASPVDRSWRYYLTTYDACGNESYASFIHKTIHTVATPVGGGDFEVHWDKYEGINYTDVDLFRHDNTNGWQNIGTFNTTTLMHPDTPPEMNGLDYIVSFNLADACTSTKAQDYNSSRSNNSSGAYNPGQSTTSIDDVEIGEITIYPNPTNGLLNIRIEDPSKVERIEIRNVNGQIVLNETSINSLSIFDLTDFAAGVYFVRFVSTAGSINHKIIKD